MRAREQVLHRIDVIETLQIENQRLRMFRITFHFLHPEHYSDDKLLSPQQILSYMESRCVCGRVCRNALVLNMIAICHYCVEQVFHSSLGCDKEATR